MWAGAGKLVPVRSSSRWWWCARVKTEKKNHRPQLRPMSLFGLARLQKVDRGLTSRVPTPSRNSSELISFSLCESTRKHTYRCSRGSHHSRASRIVSCCKVKEKLYTQAHATTSGEKRRKKKYRKCSTLLRETWVGGFTIANLPLTCWLALVVEHRLSSTSLVVS